jgi:MFS transporter, NNP family, nitrate/nitrite transporter
MGTASSEPHRRPSLLSQLGLLVAAVFFNIFARMLFSPLLPAMERDLGFSHARGGSFFFFMAAGYAGSMLLSGFLSRYITHRRTIGVALFTVSAGLVMVALSPSVTYMPIGLLVLGTGAGLYAPSGITTLTHLVEPDRWGTATAIHEVGPNIAFVVAPVFATLVVRFASWRAALLIAAGATVMVGASFLLWGKGGRFPGVPPHLSKLRLLISNHTYPWVLLFFTVAMAASLGVYGMLPSYLVAEGGMNEATANNLVSLSRALGIGAIFLSGLLADRIRVRVLLAAAALITGSATLAIGMLSGPWLVAAVLIEAPVAAGFIPVMLPVLSRTSSPELRSLAVSVTIPIAYIIGAGLVPYLLGVVAERATFALGFSLLGAVIAAAAIAASRVEPSRTG